MKNIRGLIGAHGHFTRGTGAEAVGISEQSPSQQQEEGQEVDEEDKAVDNASVDAAVVNNAATNVADGMNDGR